MCISFPQPRRWYIIMAKGISPDQLAIFRHQLQQAEAALSLTPSDEKLQMLVDKLRAILSLSSNTPADSKPPQTFNAGDKVEARSNDLEGGKWKDARVHSVLPNNILVIFEDDPMDSVRSCSPSDVRRKKQPLSTSKSRSKVEAPKSAAKASPLGPSPRIVRSAKPLDAAEAASQSNWKQFSAKHMKRK